MEIPLEDQLDMLDNTAEQFLILIQHPEKSKFIVSSDIRHIGLIGSLLLDLANNDNIAIENNRIKPKLYTTDLTRTHQSMLNQIAKSTKVRKLSTWISKFSRKARKSEKELLGALEKRGIIEIEHKRFLGIKYNRTRLTNSQVRENIITEIRDIIFNDKPIDKDNALILGLVQACNLHKVIAKDRKERKYCRNRLKEIMKENKIAQGVDKAIKEMQAVIMGAIMASTIAASTASS